MAGGGHKDLGKVRRAKIWEERSVWRHGGLYSYCSNRNFGVFDGG